jgi:tetratricopeptide (TPR) repeat protein
LFQSAKLGLIVSVSLFCLNSYGKEESQPAAGAVKAEPETITKAAVGQQSIKLTYGSATWNKNSAQLDSAFIFVRDRVSGKIVKVVLEETEPDSSVFSGSFAINLGKGGAVDPEVLLAPRGMGDSPDAAAKVGKMLATGEIKPKPLVIHIEDGIRIVDVFDTMDQAKRAKKALAARELDEKTKGLRSNVFDEKTKLPKESVTDQDLEARRAAEMKRLADEAAAREAERLRQEQMERNKVLEQERQAKLLSEKQREANRREAERLAAEALEHFNKSEFPAAEEKFKKSIELDPTNKRNFLTYGITLYRNEKMNDALIILKVTPDLPTTATERKFYLGLVHMRLNENEQALSFMREVGSKDGDPLAANGTFYEGYILFKIEEYEKSQKPFERTIDISNDPRLDEQAEAYLDQLPGLIREQKALRRKWFFSGLAGGTFDSNVLLSPDASTSQLSKDDGDFRALLGGDAEYRFKNTKTSELGAKATAFYMISTKEEISYTDPMLLGASIPYTSKGTMFGKGSRFSLKPGYELIYMDMNKDGTRELIMQSWVVGADNTFVMSGTWFSTYGVELRGEDALYMNSSGNNNADALKVALKTSQTFLLDSSAKRSVTASAGYLQSNALGDNKFYDRIDLGVSYTHPTTWGASWTNGLGYYVADYARSSNNRKDTNVSFTTGLVKPVNDLWSWIATANYTNNSSNDSANAYSKYSILGAAVFNYSM